MREFQKGDIIRYNSPEEGYVYGKIDYVYDDNKLLVKNISKSFTSFTIKPSEAEDVEPEYLELKYVEIDDARKFARYEITFQELAGGDYIPEMIRLREKYCIAADDMLAVLKKASRMPYEQFRKEWLDPMIRMVDDCDFDFDDPTDDGNLGYRFLPPKGEFVHDAFHDLFYEQDWSSTISKLKVWQKQYKLPVPERQFETCTKYGYIEELSRYDRLEYASEKEVALFAQYVDELCETDEWPALYAKADACYGGNRAFPCDWKAAEELLLKLFARYSNPLLANRLGNIYYFGRLSSGDPDYIKALQYFSIGAAGGIAESKCRIADMLTNGSGISKNGNAAAEIIYDLYNESINNIYDGQFNCEFADVALRAADLGNAGFEYTAADESKSSFDSYNNYHRNGPHCGFDSLSCYLRANFAIKMRMLSRHHRGDSELAEEISRKLEESLSKSNYKKAKRTVKYWGLYWIFWHVVKSGCRDDRLLEMEINRLPEDRYSLSIRILPRPDEKYQPKLFITEPKAHFCGYMERIDIITKFSAKIRINGEELKDDKAVIVFDSLEDSFFMLDDRLIASIYYDDCHDVFLVKYPNNEKLKKYRFASILSGITHGFETELHDYICDVPDVKEGDMVIFEGEHGEYGGEVIHLFDKTSLETPIPISQYKRVLRKA
ncbi:MAG: hypothetical protein K6G50_03325 [bacterium]|nr:hypothetical protein [bacterium]